MTKSLSLICALITTFIWGTAFIAQDTGMDNIGPLTFNAARFLVGFVAILPLALIFEKKKIINQIKYLIKNNFQGMGADSDQVIIKLIIKYPKIIERPIVVKGGVAIIGRPVDNVLKLLN